MSQEKTHNITSKAKLVVSISVVNEKTSDLRSDITQFCSRWPRKSKNDQPLFQKQLFFKNPKNFMEIKNFDKNFS